MVKVDPIRYCITALRDFERRELDSYLAHLTRLCSRRAIDYLQIRQKDFSTAHLLEFTRLAANIARPYGVKVLVNERADVALAAGADGVHLPGGSISPAALGRLGIRLIGVSCHNAAELTRAEREGAGFAVLGPVFAPLSKFDSATRPLGLANFERLARSVRMPVLALGGVTVENTAACLAAGAAGVAGITLFSASLRHPSTETEGRPEPR